MSEHRKRVAVTGLGLITPLGNNVQTTWKGLIEGKNGVDKITRFDSSKLSVQIAAEVKGFNPEQFLSSKELRKMGLFIQYAIAATIEALADAGLPQKFGADSKIAPERVGTNIAAGMGGLPEIEYWDRELLAKEKKVVSPFFVPMIIPNLASGQVSILTNAQGPSLCVVTACASSAHALGESVRMIQSNQADIMIAGGAEAVICELGIAGFASMKALSTRNQDPAHASRPYDKSRDGFVLGEGAGVVILEDWDHAHKRGAKIYGEIVGYAANADAYHMTTPAPEGQGAEKCIRLALKNAQLDPSQIGYVNSHGTSTPAGDSLEAQAIGRVFNNHKSTLHVSSTKSMTGHLLGAAGSTEAIFSILSLKSGIIPPTINLETLDDESAQTGLNFTAHKAVEKNYEYALSNSFGFGGTNATLIFKKI